MIRQTYLLMRVPVDTACTILRFFLTGNLLSYETKSMQSLVQFDSDHVLDVHDARLYPFDTYLLTTSFRATISGHDTRVPISRLIVIKVTPSFIVSSVDTAIAMFVDGVEEQARFLELRVRRPADARFYTMILFGINWILSHFNFGFVVLRAFHSDENHKNVSGVSNSSATDKYNGTKEAVKQLAGVLAALLVIPQLRDAMPDAPGFDGEFCIAFECFCY